MKSAFLLLSCAILVAFVAAKSESDYEKQWVDFVNTYGKVYSTVDAPHRYNIFKQNVDFVENFKGTHKVALNKFADLTGEEFARTYNGLKMSENRKQNPLFVARKAAPASWDWRAKGAVTGVKDQGQCGSCWAFSTVGSTEGCHFLTTGTLVSLSEQNLVDCSSAEGNQGCDGGLMDDGFQYIMDNKGIDTESSYPYTAEDGSCVYKSGSDCGSTVTSFSDVTSGDENALQAAVYSAPTSVAIDASQSSFQFYSGGVYYDANCSSQQLDHGVLAVGYGTDNGQDYWIVKNSWGTSWGDKGYIMMSRNKNNNCGIATMASLPHGCGTCSKSKLL